MAVQLCSAAIASIGRFVVKQGVLNDHCGGFQADKSSPSSMHVDRCTYQAFLSLANQMQHLTATYLTEEKIAAADKLLPLAKELGCESALELSLRFVMANNGVSTALVGYSDFGQLTDALRWAERGPLAPDAADRVVANARH